MTSPLQPKVPLFFCRNAFPVPPEQLYSLLSADLGWALPLGGGALLDSVPGLHLRVAHQASGGVLEAKVAPRGGGSRLTLSLLARAWGREELEVLAEQAAELFDAMEAKLGEAQDKLLPQAWPGVYAAPGTPPRILRRESYAWKPSSYADAPEDLMGEYAELTDPLGVTQFGADIHRLLPGERNCRNHAELHEQEGFLVLSGSCQIEIEGKVYTLGTGDFCATFPGEEHHVFNLTEAPCEVLMFGGPSPFGSGAIYPHGKDEGWRERVQRG